jgi:hypothetical protein
MGIGRILQHDFCDKNQIRSLPSDKELNRQNVPIDFKILNLIRVSSDFLNLFAE